MARTYARYLCIGGVVGVMALALRQLGSQFLPDTPFWYGALIVWVYVGGISLSFILQRRYTFRSLSAPVSLSEFFRFGLVAACTGVFAGALSYGFRYGFFLDDIFGIWAPSIAFAIAVLATSAISFVLNVRFVFKERK